MISGLQVVPRAVPRLPSQDAVIHLIEGRPWAELEVVATTAFRALLIGSGLYAAGFRGMPLVKGALLGSLVVEAFVIAHTAYAFETAPPGLPSAPPIG